MVAGRPAWIVSGSEGRAEIRDWGGGGGQPRLVESCIISPVGSCGQQQ